MRELLVKQRTALINALRGLMAEFGVIAAARPRHVGELIALLSEANGKRIPAPLHSAPCSGQGQALVAMSEALGSLERRIAIVDRQILAWGRGNRTCRHLITIPGYGPIPRFREGRLWRARWRRSLSSPKPSTAGVTSRPRLA